MATENWVNIGSGNGPVPGGTKPRPEAILTYHELGSVASPRKLFHRNYSKYQFEKNEIKNYSFKIISTSPRGHWVKTILWQLMSWRPWLSPTPTASVMATTKLTAKDPDRCQAIFWTNAEILLIEPMGTNFSEIWIGIQLFSLKKMHLKMSSAKWRPFCLCLNMVTREVPRDFAAFRQPFWMTLLIRKDIAESAKASETWKKKSF